MYAITLSDPFPGPASRSLADLLDQFDALAEAPVVILPSTTGCAILAGGLSFSIEGAGLTYGDLGPGRMLTGGTILSIAYGEVLGGGWTLQVNGMKAANLLTAILAEATSANTGALEALILRQGLYYTGSDGNDVLDLLDVTADGTAVNPTGDDVAFLGTGHDLFAAHDGADSLVGEDGNDTLYGEAGDDFLQGDAHQDQLLGGTGADVLLGGTGADSLRGDSGNDSLDGGEENDSLFGGIGNDRLEGGKGADAVSGGDGNDLALGGSKRDTLAGENGNDTLRGGTANDALSGANGDDTLNGEQDDDTLAGGAGADTFLFDGSAGDDRITDFDPLSDLIRIEDGTPGSLTFTNSGTLADPVLTITWSGGSVIVDGARILDLETGVNFIFDV